MNMDQVFNKMKDCIQNHVIKKIYARFNFNFTSYSNIKKEGNDSNGDINQYMDENRINNYLKKFKFITYQLINIRPISESENTNDNKSNKNSTIEIADAIICIENECQFIQAIDKQLIISIFENLKKQQISVLNINDNDLSFEKLQKEINNFCNMFKNDIKNNKFVEITIRPIICYLIRRYFYPTNYFKDPSFFIFNRLPLLEWMWS